MLIFMPVGHDFYFYDFIADLVFISWLDLREMSSADVKVLNAFFFFFF